MSTRTPQSAACSSSSSPSCCLRRLAYGSHPRQTIALYSPPNPTFPNPNQQQQQQLLPLLVFVHGGAWRTGSIDEHHALASSLAAVGTCCVALVEYRLTTASTISGQEDRFENQHPAHLQDIHSALGHLLLDDPSSGTPYDVRQTTLVGHSIGAWLLCSLLLDSSPAWNIPVPCINSPLNNYQLAAIRRLTKTWVLVDGIYDVEDLLEEYPDYVGFLAQAFLAPGEAPLHSVDQRLQAVSVPAWPAPSDAEPLEEQQGRVIVAHSRDDQLLTFRQSIGAAKYLKKVLREGRVVEDYETLTGDHDELLRQRSFHRWLQSIVTTS